MKIFFRKPPNDPKVFLIAKIIGVSDTTMRAEIKAYTIYLGKRKQHRANTVKAYYYDLKCLADHLISAGIVAWPDVDRETLAAYLTTLRSQGMKWNTLQHKQICFKAFFDFLIMKKGVAENPAIGLVTGRQGRRRRAVLPVSKVRQLLQAAHQSPKTGMRDTLLVELLYSDNVVMEDLRGLRILRMPEGNIILYRGDEPLEGSCLRDSVKHILEQWAGSRAGMEQPGLFRITSRQVSNILRNLSGVAGIEPCVTPLMLRDSYAVHAPAERERVH